ncbi:hypothetical protein [Thauera sp. SDU_THAU2]|uniref:hypothetical protein n=1 Tax=Thauera sp. SDU_THAU2 TaxID=3136633 RepID=UPI00311EEECA
MKLILTFNGAQVDPAKVADVIAAAGVNTTVVVNTAQAFSVAEWVSVKSAAGNKSLSAIFDAFPTPLSLMKSYFSNSGSKTSASMYKTQVWSSNDLVSLATAVGSKQLSADFNAFQSMLSTIQPFLTAAGANTRTSMNTSQTWSASDLVTLTNAAGSKLLSVDFNGAQSMLSIVKPFVIAAGANTSTSMNTSQTWSSNDLVELANAAGNKQLSLDFNGAQSMLSTVKPFVTAAGANTRTSMNTSQTWSSSDLIALANAAGNKHLSVDFNGAQSMLSTIQPFASAAGANTTVSVNTAQTWSHQRFNSSCRYCRVRHHQR